MHVLDTHLHLWDPKLLEYPWLRQHPKLNTTLAAPQAQRAFAHAQLSPDVLFMQADCLPGQALEEVDWVLSQRREIGLRGIIAFAALEREDIGAQLDALAERDLIVGVRRLIQGEARGFATSDRFVRGARALARRGWVFDACVAAHQIPEIAALADAVPELSIVLDHLGKPGVGSAAAPAVPSTEWRAALADLARRENVTCKLSGLPGESPQGWNSAQLTPFLDAAGEAFGPDRLMFASDWGASFASEPVEGYGRWFECVAQWAATDAPQVLAATGERVYLGR